MTMCGASPLIVEPLWPMDDDTMTARYDGTDDGGFELLPGCVVQLVSEGENAGAVAKPLNAAGAAPPLRLLSFHHCAPQYVTEVPTAAFWSPITKVPPAAGSPTVRWLVACAFCPPSSRMSISSVFGPRVAYL